MWYNMTLHSHVVAANFFFHGILQSVWFGWFDSLHPSQQFFRYVGTSLPGLNQY